MNDKKKGKKKNYSRTTVLLGKQRHMVTLVSDETCQLFLQGKWCDMISGWQKSDMEQGTVETPRVDFFLELCF